MFVKRWKLVFFLKNVIKQKKLLINLVQSSLNIVQYLWVMQILSVFLNHLYLSNILRTEYYFVNANGFSETQEDKIVLTYLQNNINILKWLLMVSLCQLRSWYKAICCNKAFIYHHNIDLECFITLIDSLSKLIIKFFGCQITLCNYYRKNFLKTLTYENYQILPFVYILYTDGVLKKFPCLILIKKKYGAMRHQVGTRFLALYIIYKIMLKC